MTALCRPRAHLEWRTGVLALVGGLTAAGCLLALVVDIATGGGLALARGWMAASVALCLTTSAYLVVRRHATEPEVGALLVLAALGLTGCGLAQPDLGWQWLSASSLTAVPVVAVMHFRRWMLAVVTAVSSVGTAAVFAAWEPLSLLTAVVATLMASVAPVLVLVVRTLAERLDQLRATASRAAVTDELTGLLNRHGLATSVGPLVAGAAREGRAVSVTVVDVDHFKAVNDTHGHLVGDQVLRAVAAALRSVTRGTDLVVRWGGEEIAVVTAIHDAGEVARTAERLRAAVEDVDVAGLPRVTASLGTAVTSVTGHVTASAPPSPAGPAGVSEQAAELVSRLLDAADAALYEAKRSGRNCVRHGGDAGAPADPSVPLRVVVPVDLRRPTELAEAGPLP